MDYREAELLADNMVVVSAGGLIFVVPRAHRKSPPSVLKYASVLTIEVGSGRILKTRYTEVTK